MKEQIQFKWNPNMEMTTHLGLEQFKQTARKLELTFELMNKAALTGKYVTFTFKNPLGVRYSDEAHRADLIYSPVRDEHHNELGTHYVWPVRKIPNSEFAQWYANTDNASKAEDLTSYIFIEEGLLFEVLDAEDPEFVFFTKDE